MERLREIVGETRQHERVHFRARGPGVEHNEAAVRAEPRARPIVRRPIADGAVAPLPAAEYGDRPGDVATRIDAE